MLYRMNKHLKLKYCPRREKCFKEKVICRLYYKTLNIEWYIMILFSHNLNTRNIKDLRLRTLYKIKGLPPTFPLIILILLLFFIVCLLFSFVHVSFSYNDMSLMSATEKQSLCLLSIPEELLKYIIDRKILQERQSSQLF